MESFDVAVIGCGLAGMAACIHLSDAGLKVLCIDSDLNNIDPVGESLDWSAPALLKALGFPMEDLLDQGIATYKRHVILKLRDGSTQDYVPGAWLGKAPFNVNLRTLHVDRTMLNQALRKRALEKEGVTLLRDKVVHVETQGRRVVALKTAHGERICTPWFLDASGSGSSLFARLFGSPAREFGPHKVAMWDYFTVAESVEGTTLHADAAAARYMQWVWQIPIHANAVSVGYVCPGQEIKRQRRQGLSVLEIYRSKLSQMPDLRELSVRAGQNLLRTSSFRCRVYKKITGPNWLVVGEAAAMVDPMTSNGVTAAMRHAAEASSLIARFRNRKSLPSVAAAMYSRRVIDLAGFFNDAIEKVLYEGPVRSQIGAFRAGDLYTMPAWSLNVVYSRLQPRGVFKTLLFGGLVSVLRMGVNVFYSYCRWRQPADGANGDSGAAEDAQNAPGRSTLATASMG